MTTAGILKGARCGGLNGNVEDFSTGNPRGERKAWIHKV